MDCTASGFPVNSLGSGFLGSVMFNTTQRSASWALGPSLFSHHPSGRNPLLSFLWVEQCKEAGPVSVLHLSWAWDPG